MDDFLLNRMLCEQLRDRSCWVEAESEAQRKKLLHAEIVSLIKRLKRSYIFRSRSSGADGVKYESLTPLAIDE